MKKTILISLAVVIMTAFIFLPALKKADAQTMPHTETYVEFVYGNKIWRYNKNNYNATSNIHTVREELNHRIRPTHAERIKLAKSILDLGFGYKEAVEYAFFGINKVINNAKNAIDLKPKDARIQFNPNNDKMFKLSKEERGFDINVEKLCKNIYNSLCRSNTALIRLEPEILHSEFTMEKMKSCTYLRSRFSTGYASSSPERKHNVALALKKLNGKRIDPKETLSFNTVVGQRTKRNGFLEAKIILNGQYEDGVGGGVCQSSTTLYNAAVLADLKIVKVTQHSLPISYVEPSFDAMVNSSYSDLVISNTDELPVFIKTFCTDERVTVEIYGTKLPYVIRRRSEVTGIIPHSGDKKIIDTTGKYIAKVKYKGEEARIHYSKDGLTSEGYLDYYENGKLIKSRLVRKNKYAPQQGLIVEGVLPKPPEPTPLPQEIFGEVNL